MNTREMELIRRLDEMKAMYTNGVYSDVEYLNKLSSFTEAMAQETAAKWRQIDSLPLMGMARMFWSGFLVGSVITPLAIYAAIYAWRTWS